MDKPPTVRSRRKLTSRLFIISLDIGGKKQLMRQRRHAFCAHALDVVVYARLSVIVYLEQGKIVAVYAVGVVGYFRSEPSHSDHLCTLGMGRQISQLSRILCMHSMPATNTLELARQLKQGIIAKS